MAENAKSAAALPVSSRETVVFDGGRPISVCPAALSLGFALTP